MEYNTQRNHLTMKEYGRHIQRMVEYVLTIEDRQKRQQQAQVVIELMGTLNPHLKNVEDFRHLLWDHLFFVSDFKLDVDCPYPIPTKETYKQKPDPLPYPKRKPRYSHLGKNLEIVIDKALKEENPEKRVGFANSIAYYMKLAYSNWHKELVHDDGIRAELNIITNGQLEFDSTPYVKHYRVQEGRENNNRGGGGSFGGGGFKRNNSGGGQFQRNNRDGQGAAGREGSGSRDNRPGGSGQGRDNRNAQNGSGQGRDNRNNNKFGGNKKRY
ncbi:MAG: hypothetical protein JWQ40_1443 [Segetibacter sp.]|jgi:hypothetical protein|nr:hypothetical protein [Segetibacter sp.]